MSNYLQFAGCVFIAILGAYLVIAYLAIPMLWSRYEGRHPALVDAAVITQTGDHHPGDPINIALIGSESDLKAAMKKAGWVPADPLGLRSDVEIAEATVLERKYVTAPVSNPSKRHHVRFWKSTQLDSQGRPLWAGGATFDKSVGLSHTTGQITHHIEGDVDAERKHLLGTLEDAKCVESIQWIDHFHTVLEGFNGGGDKWHTDGRLPQVELTSDTPSPANPAP